MTGEPPIDLTMPAAHEALAGRRAVEPKQAHKIDGDCVVLYGCPARGRAGIEDTGSILAPKDREGHRSQPFPAPGKPDAADKG